MGGTHIVQGDSEKIVERGVVDLEAGMGGSSRAKGGGTSKI